MGVAGHILSILVSVVAMVGLLMNARHGRVVSVE